MKMSVSGLIGRSERLAGRTFLLLVLATASAHAAPKTDVVVLKNGDHITGEIKKLEYGVLTLSTDSVGTLSIEWPSIARIQTKQYLEVEESDGTRRYGHVPKLGDPGKLELVASNDSVNPGSVALDDVVHMVPISEGKWLDRVDGNVSVGVSASSANDDRMYTVSANITYRKPTRYWNVNYSGSRTKSSNNDSSDSQDLNAQFRWLRENRWYWAASGGLTSNDQLELNLRTLVGFGLGRYWIRDKHNELVGLAGLAVSNENFTDGYSQESLEAVLQANYQFYSFDNPNLELSTGLTLYPSLTIAGRLRSTYDITARYELIKDLYYELSYTRSHDSKPPRPDIEKSDWSLTSSFGYKF